MAGTGDNPATLLGCGGKAVISLGSSYTVNGLMETSTPSASGEFNMFGYVPGRSMALSVFTNGGRVHEAFIRKILLQGRSGAIETRDWEAYIGNAGDPVLLPDESVPLRKRGILRDGVNENDPGANIRALHVSQMLALKIHSGHLAESDELHVAGGGARNRFLRQIIANVFNARVCPVQKAGFAASMGCAVSGARMLTGSTYEEAARRYVRIDQGSACTPKGNTDHVVRILSDRYRKLEDLT